MNLKAINWIVKLPYLAVGYCILSVARITRYFYNGYFKERK